MTSFEFTPQIPIEKERVIQAKLDELQRDGNIKIIFAIESGSRAWGFPSPDSDFDVRFVYARTEDSYLSVFPARDVVETPLIDDWDINGWDLSKALTLLLKPNPVLLEWMASPIRYRWDENACAKLKRFAEEVVSPDECLNHYYHLLLTQFNRHFGDDGSVKLKKYFYALRPAMALRWVRMNPNMLPPMNFQELANGTDIPEQTSEDIRTLLHAKSQASEMGIGQRVPSIDDLINSEKEWAKENLVKKPSPSAKIKARTDELFRDIVRA